MRFRLPPARAFLRPTIRPLPVYPLLIAAYAVLFLFAANVAQVAIEDVWAPLAAAVGGALLLLVLATVVFRDARRAAIVVAALVVFFFGFGHVANALAPLRIAGKFQLLGWAVFLGLSLLAAWRLRDRLPRVTVGLNVAAAALVALALFTIVPYQLPRLLRGGPQATAANSGGTAGSAVQRDIYFLVFDRYGSDAALRYHFGLQHNDLPEWLAGQGFHVQQESQANYAMTALSLAATLNMRYLDDLTAQYGRTTADVTPAYDLMKNNAVGRFLHERGYRYVQIGSWWTPTKRADVADAVYAWDAETEFAAVLRETTVVPYVTRRLGIRTTPTFRDAAWSIARYQFKTLRETRALVGPKFVFAHVLLPHPPYVFRPDGTRVPAQECRTRPTGELFREQLAYTNAEIKRVVEELLSGPEATRPIVIIQADEGPKPLRADIDWSRKATEALNVRHGVLNAMYLPGLAETGLYPRISLVNTFRVLLSRYFGADLPLLPDRSYSFPPGHAYDFTDITDQLTPSALSGSQPPPPGPAVSPANADQLCGRSPV